MRDGRSLTELDELAAALAPGKTTAGRRPDVGWESLLALAASHDLLPALWSAGTARGWWVPLPPDALLQVTAHFAQGRTQAPLVLQQAYEANRGRTVDLTDQADAILEHLGSAGIAAVPLKGLHALRAGWWADPVDRVMRDLDVLVAEDDAPLAAHVLAELGYLPYATGHTPEADHELPAVQLPGHAGSIELHTALVVRRWRAVLPSAEVLRTGPPMSTTHAVIHSIAHAQLHDDAHLLGRIPLRALHELSVLAAGPRGKDIHWADVRAAFRRVGAQPALDAHLYLARSLFGAAVPPPRGRTRATAHARLCRTLLERPPWASRYEKTVFVPRALSTERMHALYGPGSPWLGRFRHVARALGRSARPSARRRRRPVA